MTFREDCWQSGSSKLVGQGPRSLVRV